MKSTAVCDAVFLSNQSIMVTHGLEYSTTADKKRYEKSLAWIVLAMWK